MKLPKIITHPLGLTGYALALVFGLIGKFGPSNRWPWLVPAAVAMALVCVVGGLLLANRQIGAKGCDVACIAIEVCGTLREQDRLGIRRQSW
jgi:hypothetical protein